MLQYILGALALMLVFESIFPLVSPEQWRAAIKKLADVDINTIRKVAFLVFMTGAVLWILALHTDFFI